MVGAFLCSDNGPQPHTPKHPLLFDCSEGCTLWNGRDCFTWERHALRRFQINARPNAQRPLATPQRATLHCETLGARPTGGDVDLVGDEHVGLNRRQSRVQRVRVGLQNKRDSVSHSDVVSCDPDASGWAVGRGVNRDSTSSGCFCALHEKGLKCILRRCGRESPLRHRLRSFV